MTGDGSRPPGGGGGPDDIDRRFTEIVAHLQDPAPAEPAAPAEPPAPAESPAPPDPAVPSDGAPPSVLPPAASGDAARWREWEGHEASDPAEDHFVPPEPPPLPAGDLHFWAILVGLTLGPLLLLLSTVVPLLDGPVWGVLGLVLSVGGFVLLVLRSPGGGDDDWGARV